MDKPTEHSPRPQDPPPVSATGNVRLTPNEARSSVDTRPSTKWILIGVPLTLIGFFVVWLLTAGGH